MESTLSLIGSFLLVWAAIVGTASVIVHSRVPWRSTPMGRHLMFYMVSIAVVLDLGVIGFALGRDTLWFNVLRLVVFVAVPIAMTQRLWLQIQARRNSDSVEHPPSEERNW